jgi:hypothetical protein
MTLKLSECKVGDTMRYFAHGQWHVYKVTGIHLGGTGCESFATLKCLTSARGSVYGKDVEESIVPLAMLDLMNAEVA